MKNKCEKCGNELDHKSIFCTNCGTKQKQNTNSEKPLKTKKKPHWFLKLILALILLVSGFLLAMYLLREYDVLDKFVVSNDHINYANKSVTIDDTGIADAVEKVYDSVVVVETYINGKQYASGSGFVYTTDNNYGYILTNNHVISDATNVKVVFNNDLTSKIDVDIVGKDEFSDIAVLKVAKKHVLQVAVLGSTDPMRVGDTTFAVGAPLDSKVYSWSVTRGILSGKNRLVSGKDSYMNVLQTDTPINSGNSGGPLCNANGEVIGITNMKLASDSIEGIGFAIPIETAMSYAEAFATGTGLKRPYLGVSVYDGAQSFFSNETYVIVNEVAAGSPADKAGIKSGDIIAKINNEEINNTAYFRYKLYSYKIGDKIKITIKREGKEQTFEVTLTENKNS